MFRKSNGKVTFKTMITRRGKHDKFTNSPFYLGLLQRYFKKSSKKQKIIKYNILLMPCTCKQQKTKKEKRTMNKKRNSIEYPQSLFHCQSQTVLQTCFFSSVYHINNHYIYKALWPISFVFFKTFLTVFVYLMNLTYKQQQPLNIISCYQRIIYIQCFLDSAMMLFISSTFLKALLWVPNLFLANFLALFSPAFLINSINLLSYGANPETSLTIERTKTVLFDEAPFLQEIFGATSLAVVLWPLFNPTAIPIKKK